MPPIYSQAELRQRPVPSALAMQWLDSYPRKPPFGLGNNILKEYVLGIGFPAILNKYGTQVKSRPFGPWPNAAQKLAWLSKLQIAHGPAPRRHVRILAEPLKDVKALPCASLARSPME